MGGPPHAPLPWTPDGATGQILLDAAGELVVDCGARPTTSRERAQANAALIQRSTVAHQLLVATIQAAMHALRSYEHGNASPDLAASTADHCAIVLVQMEAC